MSDADDAASNIKAAAADEIKSLIAGVDYPVARWSDVGRSQGARI